jgi:hypothetical protein
VLPARGSAWFSRDDEQKGALIPGQYADLAVLSADYFTVEDDEIKAIESVLTFMDGDIVFAQGPFSAFAPPPLPVEPDWSPVAEFGGAYITRRGSVPASGGGGSSNHLHVSGPHDFWDHGWGGSCPC